MEQHEHRFHGDAERLRSPERLALLEVDRVVTLAAQGLTVTRVLDIGTGTAIFAQAFAAQGFTVAGIDANPALLEVARRLVPEVEFRVAAAEALPYGDLAFDLAFLGLVLHEADDPLAALREARRVSAGRVVVLEWPYEVEEHGPPLEHRLDPGKVSQLAAHAGLGPVEHIRLTHTDLYQMDAQRHAD
jgi:ubiquinone/menaquinone biosynthesis C-methylase UbiE